MPTHEPKPPQIPPNPEKTMTQIIEEEIAHEGKGLSWYLNNFFLKIPRKTGGTLGELDLSDPKWVDHFRSTSPMQRLQKDLGQEITPEKIAEKRRDYSEKYFNTPGTDFQRDFERAIQESGVDPEELYGWLEKRIKGDQEAKQMTYEENFLRRMLLPIYLKLREMGYSHTDLMG